MTMVVEVVECGLYMLPCAGAGNFRDGTQGTESERKGSRKSSPLAARTLARVTTTREQCTRIGPVPIRPQAWIARAEVR